MSAGSPSLRLKEVMDMRRHLLVLDMDLLAMDEEHDLEPINYLVAKQEQEPCEVVVLSLVDTSQIKLPAMELVLGAQAGKFPVAPKADSLLPRYGVKVWLSRLPALSLRPADQQGASLGIPDNATCTAGDDSARLCRGDRPYSP